MSGNSRKLMQQSILIMFLYTVEGIYLLTLKNENSSRPLQLPFEIYDNKGGRIKIVHYSEKQHEFITAVN